MADRGEFRSIHKSLLYGADFQRLSGPAQLVFLALKVNMGPSGIDRFPGMVHALTECTPYDATEVSRALAQLETFRDAVTGEAHPWIRREANVVWIVRGLEFEPGYDRDNQNHRKAMQRHVQGLPRIGLVRAFLEHYPKWFEDTGLEPLDLAAYPIPHPIPHGIPHPIPHPMPITETDNGTGHGTSPAPSPGAPGAEAQPSDASGQPLALVRPSRPAASRPKGGAKYPHFPAEVCDRLYQAWSAFGSPDYGHFRKTFARLYSRPTPDFTTEELEAGIRDAIALAKAKGGYELRSLTPHAFVERATYWVAYAKIPLVDPETRWMTPKGIELSGGAVA